ncbi:hypothetical protein AB0J71_10945 [Nonomuraea sp. NPDC049637]|uniref:hypothetical protein n=1 Tax=Nonomuraea sp. NPDC049637 TaxID=3154356 RepID=UPI003445FEDA
MINTFNSRLSTRPLRTSAWRAGDNRRMEDDLPSQHLSDAGMAVVAGIMVFLILLPTIVWITLVLLRGRK